METITIETQPTSEKNAYLVKCRVGNFDLIGINRGISLWADIYNSSNTVFDGQYVQIEGDDWTDWPAGLTEEQDYNYVSSIILRQLGLSKRFKAYFTSYPSSQTIVEGTDVSFSGAAEGYPENFTYQWHYNGTAIPNETGQSYSLTNVQISQTGTYALHATNAYETITGTAILEVLEKAAPTIVDQPVDTAIVSGAYGQLTTYADGVPNPTYQWYKDGVAVQDETSTSIVFANMQPENVGSYYVVATNSEGSAQSNTVSLSIAE